MWGDQANKTAATSAADPARIFQGAGAPSGSTLPSEAFNRGDLYLDVTNKVLYVCDTAGSKTASHWTLTTGGSDTDPFLALSALTSQVAGYKVSAWYTGAGAPSGTTLTAGSYALGDLYWDSTNLALYQCDTAGSESTSHWTAIAGGTDTDPYVPLTSLTTQISGYKVAAQYKGAGAPASGTLTAGSYAIGDTYLDTTNAVLYVCTTAGTASTSVWTAVGPLADADAFIPTSAQTSAITGYKVPSIYSGAGAPSGSTLAAGTYAVKDLYLDTTAHALYVCRTGGSESTSVWDAVDATDTDAFIPTSAQTSAISGYKVPSFYSGAGVPSGSTLAAGTYAPKDLYYDTTNDVFYICKTGGSESTSVWKLIGPFADNTDIPLTKLTSSVSTYKVPAWYSGAGAPGAGTLTAGSYAVGDMYWDTTNKAAYECDTAGNASTSTWTKVGPGGSLGVTVWKRISSQDVAGSAVGSITFSSLAGDTDLEYRLILRIIDASSGNDFVGIRPNNDSGSNYDNSEWISMQPGSGLAGSDNGSMSMLAFSALSIGGTSGRAQHYDILIAAKSGFKRTMTSTGHVAGNRLVIAGASWQNTADPITSLVVVAASGAGATPFGVGTHAEIWTPAAV